MKREEIKFFRYCENNIDFAQKVIEVNECADNYIGCDIWYCDMLFLKDGLGDKEALSVLNKQHEVYTKTWSDFVELCAKLNINPDIALRLGVSKAVKDIITEHTRKEGKVKRR